MAAVEGAPVPVGYSGAELHVQVLEPSGTELRVQVSGELDMTSGPELIARFSEIDASHKDVVLDLDGVSFMDSTGLRALWTTRQHVAGVGGTLRLGSASQAVKRVLELTNMDQIFAHADGQRRTR